MVRGDRLIEIGFPVKQVSLDSVHEKNVRHGHISTLHIWPARRPLAACRAALIATLLADPGDAELRRALLEGMAGRVVEKVERRWVSGELVEKLKEETAGGMLHWGRENNEELQWFRDEVGNAYGGRAPRVLDPFAGGGAIALEAMRLGCDVTAMDINPVAWFILKCTLEYPQRLAGWNYPLPEVAMRDAQFMAAFLKARGFKGSVLRTLLQRLGHGDRVEMQLDLISRDDPLLDADLAWHVRAWGRWVLGRARKELARHYPTYAEFVPLTPGSEYEARSLRLLGTDDAGEPPMEDIRLEGRAGRLGTVMTAVVVDGHPGKEYRLPTEHERAAAEVAEEQLQAIYADVPFGLPDEPTPKAGSGASRAFSVDGYGFDSWRKLFTNRQLLALGTLIKTIRRIPTFESFQDDGEALLPLIAMLAAALDRAANYMSMLCIWEPVASEIKQTFLRFALPITWDFAEGNPLASADRLFAGGVSNVARVLDSVTLAIPSNNSSAKVLCQSAITPAEQHDLVVTDPPYYDAIPYSDLMDFFHIWLHRTLSGIAPEFDRAFREPLGPKWSTDDHDGELIDDANRFNGDRERSRKSYEDGMARAFQACHSALPPDGRLVVAFANKQPDAWEALVSATVRAGFVVNGSWPIATEMRGGVRNYGRASLASSIWLVCRKRKNPRPGWDSSVLDEMRANITGKLRDFWDAGIRGPDFVWAATGPALEAFSRYPVVKKANAPNELMTVSEFLREVRRMVVDFVVGRVLTDDDGGEAATGLDDVTTYYLLHRHDFGMKEAAVGGCILYALSCNLSDSALVHRYDLLSQAGRGRADEPEEDDTAEDEEQTEGGGSKVKLKAWSRRRGRNLGLEAPGGRPPPLIDQVHRLMHLWRAGDQVKVDEYLDDRGLLRNALFNRILQALIELADAGSDERSVLEALSNHAAARGGLGYHQKELLTS